MYNLMLKTCERASPRKSNREVTRDYCTEDQFDPVRTGVHVDSGPDLPGKRVL